MYLYLWDYPRVSLKQRPTIETFSRIYNKGTYIISVKGHLTCISDGVLFDTWDSSQMRVCCAWKISDKPILIRLAMID